MITAAFLPEILAQLATKGIIHIERWSPEDISRYSEDKLPRTEVSLLDRDGMVIADSCQIHAQDAATDGPPQDPATQALLAAILEVALLAENQK